MVSSKGQIALPKSVRNEYRVMQGTRLTIERAVNGIFLVRVPEKPLLALEGMGKHLDLSVEDFLKERKKEAKNERKKDARV